jgi:hypothetical protein
VILCHKNKNTLTVGAGAQAAHLRHDDILGTRLSASFRSRIWPITPVVYGSALWSPRFRFAIRSCWLGKRQRWMT